MYFSKYLLITPLRIGINAFIWLMYSTKSGSSSAFLCLIRSRSVKFILTTSNFFGACSASGSNPSSSSFFYSLSLSALAAFRKALFFFPLFKSSSSASESSSSSYSSTPSSPSLSSSSASSSISLNSFSNSANSKRVISLGDLM